ncbi:hypothetical protein [Candidatus Poriferisocius sp.]|uniref:hypothetical protein n=1 Tax=Candidatus Poriferisocius sp. TaxID=3101276 RepID=UPI003B01DECB
MTAQTLVVVVAGVALGAVIWWPASSGGRSGLRFASMAILSLPRRLSSWSGPVIAASVVALGFGVGAVLVGVVTGMGAAALAGVCVWAFAVQARSRRALVETDELAQLAGVLANQALVAPTVVQAVREAAPLVSGRVGIAARQMAAECETGGLVEAASRFAATIRRPLAEMVVTMLSEAFRGGSQWVNLASVLADEAAEAAETARHFHRQVAALMPQVAVTVVMAAGMVAITGFAARDVGAWLISATGQQLLLVLALLIVVLCARVVAPAWRAAR